MFAAVAKAGVGWVPFGIPALLWLCRKPMQCLCAVVLQLQGLGDACSTRCTSMGHPLNKEVED